MRSTAILFLLIPFFAFAQEKVKSVTVDVEENNGERHIVVTSTDDDGTKKFKWVDNGEIPMDIKKQLEEADIDISGLEGDGEDVTIRVDNRIEKEYVVIKKNDGGELMEMEWDGEGEMPEEMRNLLEEHDIDLESIKDEDDLRKAKIHMYKDKTKKARFYAQEEGRKKNKEQQKKIAVRKIIVDEDIELSDAYMGAHIESDTNGARIIEILKDGPADMAGLAKGDVVQRINGARTRDMEDLLNLLNYYEPNDLLELNIIREGEEKTIQLHLGQRPESFR